MIELYAAPAPMELATLKGQPLDTLLLSGIVNPFGPTLCVVAAVGELEIGQTLPLVHLSLNPFLQSVTQVGTITLGEQWVPPRDLQPVLDLASTSCPTLVTVSGLLDEEDALEVTCQLLLRCDDVRAVRNRIKAYPGDPWTRVGNELEGAVRAAVQEKASEEGDTDVQLSAEELRKFGTILLSYGHFKPEVQAFSYAWRGSIEHQQQSGVVNQAFAQGAMRHEV